MNYGDIEVTTLEFQDGSGEFYTALDYSAGISYARRFVEWFGFGATLKYINSQIWHSDASAVSMDLGVQIYTDFLSSEKGKNASDAATQSVKLLLEYFSLLALS